MYVSTVPDETLAFLYVFFVSRRGGILKILLATGFSEIEKEVLVSLTERGDNCWRCYHRQTVIDMVNEYGIKTVVLGPGLDGTNDADFALGFVGIKVPILNKAALMVRDVFRGLFGA